MTPSAGTSATRGCRQVRGARPRPLLGHAFEHEKEMVESGVTRLFHYDPLDRKIRVFDQQGAADRVIDVDEIDEGHASRRLFLSALLCRVLASPFSGEFSGVRYAACNAGLPRRIDIARSITS